MRFFVLWFLSMFFTSLYAVFVCREIGMNYLDFSKMWHTNFIYLCDMLFLKNGVLISKYQARKALLFGVFRSMPAKSGILLYPLIFNLVNFITSPRFDLWILPLIVVGSERIIFTPLYQKCSITYSHEIVKISRFLKHSSQYSHKNSEI